MKYIGLFDEKEDIVTKEKLDAVASRVSTNEDNIAIAESDIEGLQTTVSTLQTNVNDVQTTLTSKQDTVVGGASTITENNLTENRALVSNGSGKVAVSAVTSTELGYLNGVTSNVQTQLNNIPTPSNATPKADGTASPGSSTQYAREDHIHPKQNLLDGDISWGSSKTGEATLIDASCVPTMTSNKAELAKEEGLTFEYSNDGGVTWLSYESSDNKSLLLSSANEEIKLFLGKKSTGITTDDKLRVTIDAHECGMYTNLKKVLVNFSAGRTVNDTVLVEKSMVGSADNFVTIQSYPIMGWPAWSSLYIGQYNFGYYAPTQNTNIARLRFTFSVGLVNEPDTFSSVNKIFLLGVENYTNPSTISRTGHLYEYDIQGNAYFPNNIQASGYTGETANTTATFSQASSRANIATGEKLSTIFGKIAKWFSDLGALAFKSKVAKSDLSDDIQSSLDKADTALQTAPVTSVNGQTGSVTIRELPSVTTSDNGKFLRVVNGAWSAETIPNANGGSF